MRRNGYLRASGKNSDASIRYLDPISVWRLKSDISAIWIIFEAVFSGFLLDNLKVRYISTSGLYLTFSPRKCVVGLCCAHYVDNFFQVWNWWDNPCLQLIRHVSTWPWPLIFWPRTVVLRDQSLHRSWVSYDALHWLLWRMRLEPLRMRRIT